MGSVNSEIKGPLIEPQEFRRIIGHFTNGVTIITTKWEEQNWGITASAFCSVALEPPMVLVCVNKNTGTCNAISNAKKFGVNILQEAQGELARKFAQPQTDKFKDTEFSYGPQGMPLLEGVLAQLECKVVNEVTAGTHSIFVAEVLNATADDEQPLVYHRGKFGRFDLINE